MDVSPIVSLSFETIRHFPPKTMIMGGRVVWKKKCWEPSCGYDFSSVLPTPQKEKKMPQDAERELLLCF